MGFRLKGLKKFKREVIDGRHDLKVPVLNWMSVIKGKAETSRQETVLHGSLFNRPVNPTVIHQVIRWQRAMHRQVSTLSQCHTSLQVHGEIFSLDVWHMCSRSPAPKRKQRSGAEGASHSLKKEVAGHDKAASGRRTCVGAGSCLGPSLVPLLSSCPRRCGECWRACLCGGCSLRHGRCERIGLVCCNYIQVTFVQVRRAGMMAALSSKAQEDRVVVVNSLTLSAAEAEACLRTELEDIKLELIDINREFVPRRKFRQQVYAALDGDSSLFEDAEGNPLDADSAVDAVMERLRENETDVMSLLESTREALRPTLWPQYSRGQSIPGGTV